MGSIDTKIQEAIEDIKAHGSRIKNLFKKDPINNTIDDNWKLNLKANDLLVKDQNESSNEHAHKNKTIIKSVPLKNSSKNDVSKKTNRTLRISNLETDNDDSEIEIVYFKVDLIKGHLEQSYTGNKVHEFKLSELKDTPTICFLAEIWPEIIVWLFRHTWYHFWAFPVTMTSF